MNFGLRDYQLDAVSRMKNGCILCGGMGSGKSRTALAYYYKEQGGHLYFEDRMPDPKDLYVITTARKRDEKEWELDMAPFLITPETDLAVYDHKVVVDSWNNISKYKEVKDAFFIFDEQRVVGNGTWVKAFLRIAKHNDWILLSATPGDTWSDYIPVFLAHGFYRNRTDFNDQHIVYSRFTTFPKIDKYVGLKRLTRLRDSILVDMDYEKHTITHREYVYVEYDKNAYKDMMVNRWDADKDKPIENASELCYALRKISNSSEDRLNKVMDISEKHRRVIIFYNFDYELELLKELFSETDFEVAEWNGHKHQEIPETPKWVYLVQYTAGAEGWNCLKTDTIIFFSQNYSYKVLTQAMGRIDRLNTPFVDLYFYMLLSKSNIDLAIRAALSKKKKFNERKFVEL